MRGVLLAAACCGVSTPKMISVQAPKPQRTPLPSLCVCQQAQTVARLQTLACERCTVKCTVHKPMCKQHEPAQRCCLPPSRKAHDPCARQCQDMAKAAESLRCPPTLRTVTSTVAMRRIQFHPTHSAAAPTDLSTPSSVATRPCTPSLHQRN